MACRIYRLRLCLLVFILTIPVSGSADTIVPLPAPMVRSHVDIWPSPNKASGPLLGRLTHADALELIDARMPGWYRVRLKDGRDGYVPAEFTKRVPGKSAGSAQIEIVGFPKTASEEQPQLTIKTITDPPLFGVKRDLVPLFSLVLALCGVGLSVYTGHQTNIRNRHETFRNFRERFEDVRNSEKNYTAWNIVDFDAAVGLTAVRRTELLTLEGDKADQQKENLDKLKATLDERLSAMERYWIRTFDEWYITTTGGKKVKSTAPGPIGRWFNRMRVYRPLWDDYYREAITRTLSIHPALLLGLIWDPAGTKVTSDDPSQTAPPRPRADQLFIRQMWWILASDGVRARADEQLKIVNAWRKRYGLVELRPPAKPR